MFYKNINLWSTMLSFVITISLCTATSNKMPDIHCKPDFATITQMVNKSYLIVGQKGQFWRVDSKGVFDRTSITGLVKDITTKNNITLKEKGIDKFDFNFMINFGSDTDCWKDGKIYGLKFKKKGTNKTLITVHTEGEWTDVDFLQNDPFFEKAKVSDKRIGAVLQFYPHSIVIIQGTTVSQLYCEKNNSFTLRRANPFVFDKDSQISKIEFNNIYGGYVDHYEEGSNKEDILYLFPAKRTEGSQYLRQYFLNCNFKIFVNNIALNCNSHTFESLCKSEGFFEKHRTILLTILLTIVAIFSIIVLLMICIGIYFCCKNKMNKKDSNKISASKKTGQDSEEVAKPGLARERTFGRQKSPGLNRIRKVEFNKTQS